MAIIAYLYYEDVASARKFLAKAFGFRNYGPTNKRDGRLVHAAMQLGDDDANIIMMGWPGPKYRNPRRLGGATQCLYVNLPDVERHYARAQKAGAKIIDELKATPFGQRRYGAEDPEGHQWFFGESVKRRSRRKPARTRR